METRPDTHFRFARVTVLAILAVSLATSTAAAPPSAEPASLAGEWKTYVNGVAQHKGQQSQTGGFYVYDFHYRFEVKGREVVVIEVVDSDDDNRISLKGDERVAAKFKLDGRRIKGKRDKQELTGAFNETFDELTWRWLDPYAYSDYDNRIRKGNVEVLRRK